MLEITIVSIFFGIVLHFINDRIYIFYYLFLYFIFPYILSISFSLDLEDNQYLTNRSPIFIFVVFLIEGVKNKFRFQNLQSLFILVLLFTYVLYGVVLHGAPFDEYFLHFFVSFIAPLFCCANLFYWKEPDWQKLKIVVSILFAIELALFFLQYFFGVLTPDFREDSVTLTEASGTLAGGNVFSTFVLLFLCYFLMYSINIQNQKKWILVVLSFFAILLSGVRTYLICFLLFVPLSWFLTKKRKVKPLFVLFIVVFALLFVGFVSNINKRGYATNEADNPIERQLYGLSNFSRGESTTAEKSTMFLSLVVFSEYFVNNPLFGNWQLYTEGSYDPVSPENENVMDAGLAVYLSDLGVIGMLLYILFQISIYICDAEKQQKKQILMFYLYALTTTYTDIGIFGGMFTCCILIVCSLIKNNQFNSDQQLLCDSINDYGDER